MRYCIQPATSVDVAFLAAVMDDNGDQWTGDGEAVPVDRLLQTCACSAQIWAARDSEGNADGIVGRGAGTERSAGRSSAGCWRAKRSTTRPANCRRCRASSSAKCLTNSHGWRISSTSRKVRAIEMLRSLGFAVEPALPQPAAEGDLHRVWIDSDRLHAGRRRRPPAELTPSFHLRAARMSG